MILKHLASNRPVTLDNNLHLLLHLLLLLLLLPRSFSTETNMTTSTTSTTTTITTITSQPPTSPWSTFWTDNATLSHTTVTTPTTEGMCRDRLGIFLPPFFRLWTCGFCFQYVYKNPTFAFFRPFHIFFNTSAPPLKSALPDTDRPLEVQKVCRAVEEAGHDCRWWLDCCEAAQACCRRQLSHQAASRGGSGRGSAGGGGFRPGGAFSGREGEGGRFCPATWDGFSCWDDSPAGSEASVVCPSYIEQATTEGLGHKRCEENGTWYVSPLTGMEWTNYTSCVTIQHYWMLLWVAVVCDGISLLLLLPASFTFLYVRTLRNQPRIRLHLCLFVTLVIFHCTMLLHEVIVVSDRLTSAGQGQTVLDRNPAWCRLLHVVTRYGWCAVNSWMLLESLYLYRLMGHAFHAAKSLLPYYLTGFGVPWLFVIPYTIVRTSHDRFNVKCWAFNAGRFEWIISTSLLLCLVGSLGFLGKTLYIMMTQLQSHPNEPSNFRRGVKALLMLVPLFGLQSVLIMVRPSPTSMAYEVISSIIISTQGAIVAVIFCYLNGEVLTIYRNALRVWLTKSDRHGNQNQPRCSVSTQLTTDTSSRSLVSFTPHPHPLTPSSPLDEDGGGGRGRGGGGGSERLVPLSPLGGDAQSEDADAETNKQDLQNGSV